MDHSHTTHAGEGHGSFGTYAVGFILSVVLTAAAFGLVLSGAVSSHAALLVALVLTGVLIGGAAAVALGRSLVRSDQGRAPVPSAVLAWPWATEVELASGLVLVCLVIGTVAAAMQVQASDTSQLRMDEGR